MAKARCGRWARRRGQVTLYVVLGLLVLIAVLVFLVLKPRSDEAEPLPSEFAPVQSQVELCLRDLTIDGLKLLAMHGGYLNPLDKNETGRPLQLNPFSPTESDLLLMNPGDNESAVPYYYYVEGPNDCTACRISTLTPTKEGMERALERYVGGRLPECLSFDNFPDIRIVADPKQTVDISLEPLSVLVDYQRSITLTKGTATANPRRFRQEIKIPFLQYFEVARQITAREIDTQFLESYLLYLVSAYSGVQGDLPPIAGYSEKFMPSFWLLFDVRQRYTEMVRSVTPALQVLDTAGVTEPPSVNDPYTQGFLRMSYLDLLNDSGLDASRMRVSILVPDGPLYLDVHPRKGQSIQPRRERTAGLGVIPARQQDYYDFYYDLSVPFVVEIREENAVPGTDISFLFAIEANLRENKNMAQWLLGRGTIPWSYQFVRFEMDSQVLQNQSGNGNGAPAPSYQHNESLPSLLCDETVATAPLSVRTFDARTGKAIDGVLFSYSCGLYASCDAGMSVLDEQQVYAALDTTVSPCIGATLRVEKEGYNSAELKVTTTQGRQLSLPDITLDPFITRSVRIEKREIVRNVSLTESGIAINPARLVKALRGNDTWDSYKMWEWNIGSDSRTLALPEELNANETVIVNFLRVAQTSGEGMVSATAVQSPENRILEVSLIPGLYEVRAFYIDGRGRSIPAKCNRVKTSAVCVFSCDYDYFPNETVRISPAPWGGLELTDQTTYWQLERDELYTKQQVVVPVIIAPPPLCIDDLSEMDNVQKYTREFSPDAMVRME